MLLIWFLIAFLLGIVAGDWLHIPALPLAGAAALCAGLSVVLWRQRDARMSLLLAAACLLGMARIAAAVPVTTERSVWRFVGHTLVIEGTVVRQPDRREDRQSAVIAAERVTIGEEAHDAEGLVLLKLRPNPELRYGQRISVAGYLDLPASDGEFDYRAYLARHGVYVLMNQPKVALLPGEGGSWWRGALLHLNDRARQTGLRLLGEPHASLLVGVLLGVQATIPEDVLDAFSATGTSHILVISGWNISVLVASVAAALGAIGISRKRAALISLPLIAAYVLFVGATPSVLRAGIMGSLAVVAVLVDREAEAWTSLLLACAVMAALDPHVLWDIGFQLSALATAGLFAFARPIEQGLRSRGPLRWRWLGWAIEPLTATLAASLLSLPILLYHFGRLSLIAPLANALMLPAVPPAMLFGALATIGGLLWLPLGQVLALLAWPFLQWMLLVSRLLARFPGAYTTLPPFSIGWLAGYYVTISLVFAWTQHRAAHRSSDLVAHAHVERTTSAAA